MENENSTQTNNAGTTVPVLATPSNPPVAEGTEQNQGGEQVKFDPSLIEESFGLPAGSLKGAKDEAGAYEVVRSLTDKTLVDGLSSQNVSQETFSEPETHKTAKPADKPKVDDGTAKPNKELETMRAELAEIKAAFQQQAEATQRQLVAQFDNEFLAEVDSWESPKYGVAGSRNFDQIEAVMELRYSRVPLFVAGNSKSGRPLPQAAAIARSCRVHHDEGFKPGEKKEQAKSQQVLGTPGARRDVSGAGADGPRNIHEAISGGW